jgi:hypothetical protein
MTLEQKIRDVLARLSTLSEAPAGNLEAQIARSAPESAKPGGATLRLRSDRPPPKARSLFDWYQWQFSHNAADRARLLSLYLLAEREYLERTDREAREETAQKGSILAYSQDGAAVESIAAMRVIEWYEGVQARDVATVEDATESWVRKVRSHHGRNSDDGRPRSEFLSWDEDRRIREVASLHARGMGQKKAADRLGIAKSTLQRYWPAGLVAA